MDLPYPMAESTSRSTSRPPGTTVSPTPTWMPMSSSLALRGFWWNERSAPDALRELQPSPVHEGSGLEITRPEGPFRPFLSGLEGAGGVKGSNVAERQRGHP